MRLQSAVHNISGRNGPYTTQKPWQRKYTVVGKVRSMSRFPTSSSASKTAAIISKEKINSEHHISNKPNQYLNKGKEKKRG